MDNVDPFRFFFAFIFVLGLIGVMAFLLKRFAAAQKLFIMPQDGGRVRVVEVRPIDAKRRLVLVRRDDTEHLLLLADGREMMIESGIRAGDVDA